MLLDLAQGSWGDVERICRNYPRLSVVVTWVGYRQLRPLFALLRRCSNLYCDLSNLSTYLGIEEILDRFGSERLIFGTGLPTADPGGPIARLFYTNAPPSALHAIAHGNIERLLDRVQQVNA
jgi:predicted TIM-barrel fold metal-dependent hydrolase